MGDLETAEKKILCSSKSADHRYTKVILFWPLMNPPCNFMFDKTSIKWQMQVSKVSIWHFLRAKYSSSRPLITIGSDSHGNSMPVDTCRYDNKTHRKLNCWKWQCKYLPGIQYLMVCALNKAETHCALGTDSQNKGKYKMWAQTYYSLHSIRPLCPSWKLIVAESWYGHYNLIKHFLTLGNLFPFSFSFLFFLTLRLSLSCKCLVFQKRISVKKLIRL